VPEQYLKRKLAPVVLSISARRRLRSKRFKEVVETARNRFMHHLELTSAKQIDAQVVRWLTMAWTDAGAGL
jgi:hypothetical protein